MSLPTENCENCETGITRDETALSSWRLCCANSFRGVLVDFYLKEVISFVNDMCQFVLTFCVV